MWAKKKTPSLTGFCFLELRVGYWLSGFLLFGFASLAASLASAAASFAASLACAVASLAASLALAAASFAAFFASRGSSGRMGGLGGAGGVGGRGRTLGFFSGMSPWLVVMRRSGPPLPMVPLTVLLLESSSPVLICA